MSKDYRRLERKYQEYITEKLNSVGYDSECLGKLSDDMMELMSKYNIDLDPKEDLFLDHLAITKYIAEISILFEKIKNNAKN